MLKKTTHRYSFLILPIIYLLDGLLILFFVTNFRFDNQWQLFAGFLSLWFIISYFTKFYEVYRNTKPAEIISKTLKQVVIFDLSVVTVFHFLSIQFPNRSLLKYLLILNVLLFLFKFLIYVLLKLYRSKGGNIRHFIIVGFNEETKQFKNILENLLPKKFIQVMILKSKIDPEKQVNLITKEERKRLVKLMKGFSLQPDKLLGFGKAIITTGGIDLKEVDSKTMQSRLIPNLYFAGEVLDLDGPTGGYNLQIAWSTGYAAGTSS